MLTGEDGMVEFFDTLEQTDWNQSMQRTLIHWLGIQDTYHVLDAGCGAGRFAAHLAQRSEWVTALDVSEKMVARTRRSATDFGLQNMSFAVGNLCQLPFPEASFDLVTCLDVLFMCEQPQKGLQELTRVLKPSGQLVVLNPSALMNPWSAQKLVDERKWKDFQRDSFLAWSTAAAKRRLYDAHDWAEMAHACGGELTDSLTLLEGLVAVYKFVRQDRPAEAPGDVVEENLSNTESFVEI
ncbi:class I SAM-dependent methyltransferase [Alicyclobacillus sp. ALC3]|uniref:class I SAM-dependent methyltransferase n=1 Tax=Alicyclobacillus sp. ALC3 TaxID=2796143 RepID=UPI0023794DED|nr:methyltransferase domain-containing protein [Alicyclobacillus sp. ALC3]WDL95575.1 methyltransferase domain-containing protein [Alicyclobacillus sp. ALC3]